MLRCTSLFLEEAAMAVLFGAETARKAYQHYSGLYPGDKLSAVVKILTDFLFTCSSQALALALQLLHEPLVAGLGELHLARHRSPR